MIIGLTGTLSSGKDAVADYLKTKGYRHYSLADVLREIAEDRGIVKNRDNLRDLANELAREKGPSYLAEEVVKRAGHESRDDYVFSAIRTEAQAKYLKQRPDFIFIGVDADPTLRYSRSVKRAREGEQRQTYEHFIAAEQAEMSGDNVQRLDLCMNMVDYKIMNNGTLLDLQKKIDEILKENSKTVSSD